MTSKLLLALLVVGQGVPAMPGDLRMVNQKSVIDWGASVWVDGTWTATERLNPGVVRIECKRQYQGWQETEGPECAETTASLFPVGSGDFTPDLSFSYFAVQSWTATELTALAKEGVCEIGYLLRINFGRGEKQGTDAFSYTRHPDASVTKTKIGPLATHGVCGELAKDFSPYTMTLTSGPEAMAQKKVWWPFR